MTDFVDFAPGPETYEENRKWQGCPSIAITKGGRMFATILSGGVFEPCRRNCDYIIRSDDGGDTWSRPILAVYTDEKRHQRCTDMQLWVDPENRLWAMWSRMSFPADIPEGDINLPANGDYFPDMGTTEAMVCEDPDADVLEWKRRGTLFDGLCRNKPLVTADGRYLFPSYDWVYSDRYVIRVSEDRGETFHDMLTGRKAGPKTFDETMLYEYGSTLRILARTDLGFIVYSDSHDGGRTWTDTLNYQKAPTTRFYIGRLKSGNTVFVRNLSDGVIPMERTGIKICLSEDGGNTYPYELVLDVRHNVSYPDLSEDADGNIFIIYDRERDERKGINAAKEILLSRITENDIRKGYISEASYTGKVISKATGTAGVMTV